MLGVALWAALRHRSARPARIGLAVVGAYFMFCAASRWLAMPARETGRVRLYAQPLNPFRWTVVRQASDDVVWSDGETTRTFVSYRDDTLVPKAEATEAVKLFRWFAEFPVVEQLTENGRTVLRYRDLRFRTRMPWGEVREGLFVVAKVVFDERGNVIASSLAGENR
jgi:hypothetical protein